MNRYAIIVAGGSGTRMRTKVPKQFLGLNGSPIVVQTIQKFLEFDESIQIILVLPKNYLEEWGQIQNEHLGEFTISTVAGGSTRTDSVKAGLDLIEGEGLVAIHDAVRPFVSSTTIEDAYESAKRFGSGIASVKMKDSLRELADGGSSMARDRTKFVSVQTPQTFTVSTIKRAYEIMSNQSFSDDATVYEKAGFDVHLVEGSYANLKITTPEDLT